MNCKKIFPVSVKLFFFALLLNTTMVFAENSFSWKKGETPPTICIPAQATAAEQFAASELQTYLKKITGELAPIATGETIPQTGKTIILGRHPRNSDLKWSELSPDEFIIEALPDTIRIAGGVGKEITNVNGQKFVQERGTLYGVYEFLENLGVRWYRPEPWGEYVPNSEQITLPSNRKKYQPGYKYRYGMNGYRWWKDETMEQRALARLWATRNRQNCNMWTGPEYGGYYHINFAHNYMYLVPTEQYFATHPEYFALVNSKRSDKPEAQLCLSNPDVQQLFVKAIIGQAKSNPQAEVISVEPNDMSLWCECNGCKAMDDPKLSAGFGGISMANRVCAFNSIVARKVAEQAPQVKVGWLAYNQHTEVPTLVTKLEPNTVVMATAFAGAYSDYSRKLTDPASMQNARFIKILEGYGRLTQIFVHDYFSGYAWFGPLPIIHTMVDRLRAYRHYNVVGLYSEMHPHWGPQGLELYFYCKLLWNPDLDVNKELDLYYKNYYGLAAKPMKEYHELLEKAATNGSYFGSGGSGILNLFSNDLLEKLKTPIETARQLVKGKVPYEQRIEGVWAGYEFARRFRQAANLKDKNQIVEAVETLDNLDKFVLSYKAGDVFDNGPVFTMPFDTTRDFGKTIREQAELLGKFENPQVAQIHDKNWRFQTDEKDEGLKSNWMSGDFTVKSWPLIDADRWWQEQGYSNYHGIAWYRRSFTPPALEGSQRLVLYFGAVDGDSTVFINGKKVGEHNLQADGVGWDKLFYFDITSFIIPNQSNVIAVRVKKLVAMSGMFKGVKILKADKVK